MTGRERAPGIGGKGHRATAMVEKLQGFPERGECESGTQTACGLQWRDAKSP